MSWHRVILYDWAQLVMPYDIVVNNALFQYTKVFKVIIVVVENECLESNQFRDCIVRKGALESRS